MMFLADTAFGLELIALGIGFWVLIRARNAEAGNLKGLGTFLGYFIIVGSFLVLLCTSYYTVRYWEDGHFRSPGMSMPMMGSVMMGPMHSGMNGSMHGKMMGNQQCGEMQKKCMTMMQEKMEKMDMEDEDGMDMDRPMKSMMEEHHQDQ
ncbi:MAG: hypothetical protein D6762_08770 [Candidatus Neomarinimicrobiota bacterium]|nr:MAG: hypothetical protein D6762_08770 [Candidatus Neomarinimicrobiota bacterium]